MTQWIRRAQTLAVKLKVAAALERRTLSTCSAVLVTVAWSAVMSMHPALAPLLAIPALCAARLRDRHLGLLLGASTVIVGATLARAPSVELAVWHGFLLASSLVVVYALAEHWMPQSPVDDVIDRLLETVSHPIDRDLAILVDCEGFEQLDEQYGTEARHHVSHLLRRAIEEETSKRDVVTRTGDQEYLVVLQDTDPMEANKVLDRVRHTFQRAIADAGYDCAISVAYAPLEISANPLIDMPGYTSASLAQPNCYGAYLN